MPMKSVGDEGCKIRLEDLSSYVIMTLLCVVKNDILQVRKIRKYSLYCKLSEINAKFTIHYHFLFLSST